MPSFRDRHVPTDERIGKIQLPKRAKWIDRLIFNVSLSGTLSSSPIAESPKQQV